MNELRLITEQWYCIIYKSIKNFVEYANDCPHYIPPVLEYYREERATAKWKRQEVG
jgi:hypothetical protein